ncbi:winged helix-turn-helix transcriptional regulator [Peribacillus sp. SCS-26]
MGEILSGTKRFCEQKNGIEGISQKVLTQNLRSM